MSDATPDIQIGDVVTRSSKGKRFIVTDFWGGAVTGQPMAGLKPVEGYTKASHPVSQLVLIERPGATEDKGWGYPTSTATKAHYFGADGRSLCGRYGSFGIDTEPETGPTPNDCTPCRRRLDARSATS